MHTPARSRPSARKAYLAITAGACPSAAVRAFQSMPLLSIGCDDRVSQIAVTKGRRQPTSRVSSAVLGRHTVVNETYAISNLDSRANDGLKAETGSNQGASEHGMRPAGKSGQLQRNYVLQFGLYLLTITCVRGQVRPTLSLQIRPIDIWPPRR